MNASNHVDVETLNMLKEVMEDGFGALLDTYINDAQLRIDAIKAALENGVADDLRREAHSLKGSSGNLGAQQMASLSKIVEDKGRAEEFDGVADIVVQIEQEYQEVSSVLKGMLH